MFGRWLSWCSCSSSVFAKRPAGFSPLSSSNEKLQKYVVGAPLGGWPACTPAPRERGAKGNI